MEEFLDQQLTELEIIPDMSIGDILLFMQRLLPCDEQGSPQKLQFTSLELTHWGNTDSVSLVLTAKKY